MIHMVKFPSSRPVGLTLFCVLFILFAWAAPTAVAVIDELWDYDQPVIDLANEQTDTTDVTDDPAVLFANGRPGLHSLKFSLSDHASVKLAWSPAPPLRPPTTFN